jgi:hypothetical protein
MATLYGTVIGEKIVPFDSLDTYPTHEDFYGQGGYVVVENPYATNVTLNQLMGLDPVIESGRRKKGQLLYLPSINKHFIYTTTNLVVSTYDIKPALPYEYEGSFLSTSFVAKTSSFANRNIISSAVGTQVGDFTWQTELYEHCCILGGSSNAILKDSNAIYYGVNVNSTIVGGSGNRIDPSNYSTILGGDRNYNFGNHSVVLGGSQNRSVGPWNTLGGGLQNKIGGAAQSVGSVLVGGAYNTNLGNYNFLGGGYSNKVAGQLNAIVGGESNESLGINDLVVGGKQNKTLGSTESGKLLFATQYLDVNINPNYLLDTKFFISGIFNEVPRVGGTLVESIPGATAGGFDTAGIIRLYPNNNTVASSLTGRTLARTITSPTPSLSGRFGHSIFNIYSSRNNNRYGLIVGEPGSNKVHIYSLTGNDAFGQPALLQTINLQDVDLSAPVNSLFGLSIAYNGLGYNDLLPGNVPAGSPFSLLYVGAPGNSTVYVFKSDKIDPVTDGATPFTYVTKITGQTGSEFGYSIITNGAWRGISSPSLSASFVCVGAPNKLTPSGRTGDALLFYSTIDNSTYTRTNKTFSPYSSAQSIINYALNSASPGDRIGESFGSGLNVGFRFDTPEIQQQASNNATSLTSWNTLVYLNIPKKDINLIYRVDPQDSNTLADQYFVYDLNLTSFPTGYTNKIVLSGGTVWGQNTYFTSASSSINGGYGAFSVMGQGYFSNTTFYGPGKSKTGVYSLNSILNATNLKWDSINNYTGSSVFNRFGQKSLSKNPRVSNHPGQALYYSYVAEANGTLIVLPYPTGINYNNIESYGFLNYDVPSDTTSPGIINSYYISGGKLSLAILANDLPGETITASVIVGGNNNTIGAKSSTIIGGVGNNVAAGNGIGFIGSGNQNTLTDSTGDGVTKLYNSVIQGNANIVDGTQFSTILNGSNNKINRYADNSAILGGSNNTINRNISACYVLGLSLTGNKSNTVFIENLKAVGHIEAKTKSFTIKHPTKEGKTLTYGSLESPYHGIRLTGFDRLVKNTCVIKLPDYICKLVKPEFVNIQITNYKHSKLIYVDNINIPENTFTVKTDSILGMFNNYEFFWTFTAVRSDVPEIQVES